VDSSLVAALTSAQTSNLNAFTVSFHDRKFDESPFAKQVCQKYGINYNEIKVNVDDFLISIEKWVTIQDDIVADPSALLLYKLSEFASSLNYRVLLAGEGSDELFGGYNAYKYFTWSQKIYNSFGGKLPFRKQLISLFKDDSKKYNFLMNSFYEPSFYGTAMIYEPHLLNQLLPGSAGDLTHAVKDIKYAMDLDIKDRLQNDVLTRSDRSTSGTSVELRVPFLAHQIVDFSASVSSHLFMKNKTPKYLIKKLASKYIDPAVIYRKKVGFDLPLGGWISNELKGMFLSAINGSIQKDFIDIKVVESCFNLHVNRNIDSSAKLWAFLCLELSFRHLSGISK
jgi:asparagine synthase (glutamine-hydrolysing)